LGDFELAQSMFRAISLVSKECKQSNNELDVQIYNEGIVKYFTTVVRLYLLIVNYLRYQLFILG
jgi:hypothetical protein